MADVSITDIAQAAGVSPSTVSRALQNHPRISSARRTAIQALAREMGYQPSQVARSLVTGETRTLGVVVTDITDPFVAQVLTGAEQAARAAGYTLIFATSHRDPKQELEAARLLVARQVDGMLVISSRSGSNYGELQRRGGRPENRGLPVVLVNNDQPGRYVYSVRMDNAEGAGQAVSYLHRLGHTRIGFLAGPEAGRSSRERQLGYADGMALEGLSFPPAYVIPGSGQLEDGAPSLAALRAISVAERPTAVLCYNDLAAIGLLAAVQAAGLRVPQDLSVVGYDNIPLSAYTVPSLTTVNQPTQEMGRLAVEMCLAVLAGGSVRDTVLPGELIVRASAAGPA